jgi:hypothetical protein
MWVVIKIICSEQAQTFKILRCLIEGFSLNIGVILLSDWLESFLMGSKHVNFATPSLHVTTFFAESLIRAVMMASDGASVNSSS